MSVWVVNCWKLWWQHKKYFFFFLKTREFGTWFMKLVLTPYINTKNSYLYMSKGINSWLRDLTRIIYRTNTDESVTKRKRTAQCMGRITTDPTPTQQYFLGKFTIKYRNMFRYFNPYHANVENMPADSRWDLTRHLKG